MYDLIIIDGGPAGAAAAVYSGRKQLKTLLITESFGGQSLVSNGIENWIGTLSISGYALAQALEEHVRAQETVETAMPERVTAVRGIEGGFEVTSDQNKTYQTKTILICSGGRRRKLQVPGEAELDGKGVAYCSTCDAPFFRNKTVAVIGGGNAGLEAVVDLLPYATKVYLLSLSNELNGDPLTQNRIKESDKVTIINRAKTTEILGDQVVKGLKYEDLNTNEIKQLELDGVFIEIGTIPNTEFIKDLVELNKFGEIVIDHRSGATSKPGIFAAGDVTDELFKQNNIAAGDAVKATLAAYNFILGLQEHN